MPSDVRSRCRRMGRRRMALGRMVIVITIAAVSLAATLVAWPVGAARAAAQPAADLLRLPFPTYDGTLTPYSFELGYPLVTLVYDTLLWRDARGIPRPWLARSVTSSDGGRRLTVRLRSGVRWHDGRPVTAEDVAFTFGFAASHFHPRFTPELADVARVRVTGALSVTIDLRRISLGFEDQPLADLPILPRHLWEGLPPGLSSPLGLPVGSGPYRLLGADPLNGYSFRANHTYFEGRPSVEKIHVPIISQEQGAYDALRGRRIDMLPLNLPQTPAQDLGSSLGISLRRGPSYSGTTLLLNLRRPPFDRLAARRALASALDLQRIVRNVEPAVAADQGFIHPASPWSSGAPVHRLDLRAAQTALAALKLPAVHVLAPDNDPVRLEAGRQVVLALERAGATATLTKLSSARLGRAIGENGTRPEFEAAIETIPPLTSYDPDFLARLFGSNPRAAPLNFGGYRSVAFDALAERVAAAPDPPARHRAARAELALLATDVPSIPLFFSQGTFAYRPAIYDSWVFVQGNGILDKRSFLPGQAPVRGGPLNPDVGAGAPTSSGSGFNIVDAVSVVVLAAVLALAGTALLRRRSTGRR